MPTMVEPTGEPMIIENVSPTMAQKTDIILDIIVTLLNVLHILIDDIAGNTISADTRREPTRFIASTITIAVIVAIRKL